MNIPIAMRLNYGPHQVDVVGKLDSGLYQDDPMFGTNAVISSTPVFLIERLRIASEKMSGTDMHFDFPGHAGESYTVQYRDTLDAAQVWATLTNVPAQPADAMQLITDVNTSSSPTRFYRVRVP